MWIITVLLVAVLYVPTAPSEKCCHFDPYMRDRTERDEYGRVVSIRKVTAYANLDSGAPLTDEVKRRFEESRGDRDVIGSLIDQKLGGSGNDSSNFIPMNIETHVIWRYKVTNPIYSFLRNNTDKKVLFSVKLFYDDINITRPFFLGVNHRFCTICVDPEAPRAILPPLYEQYVVKGFIPNPFESEAVIPYLYGTEKTMYSHGFSQPQKIGWVHISFSLYNETMKRKYEQVTNRGGQKGPVIRKVEWTQMAITHGILNTGRTTVKADWDLIRVLGNENDVPGTLISSKLGGSYWANFVPMAAETFEEMEDSVAIPIIEYFNDTRNENKEVILRVDLLYDDKLALRPAGFFVTASIQVKLNGSIEETTTGCPEIPKRSFIRN